jgi:SAM-dependent methyltransferase
MAIDWSTVAEAWDRNADRVEQAKAPATKVLLDRLSIRGGERVLELGAGPGSLGRRLADLTGDGGHVLLTDIAPGMVEVARRRNAGVRGLEVLVADATDTRLPAGGYDVVLFRMGLMLVEEPARAVAEIRRLLAPGGRASVVVWAGMEHNPWLTAVGMAAMSHGLVQGGPPVGPGGVFSLADPSVLAGLLTAGGFDDLEVTEVDTPFTFDDEDDHFAMVSVMAPPLADALRAASPEALAAVRQTAASFLAPHRTGSGSGILLVPGRALVATAHA